MKCFPTVFKKPFQPKVLLVMKLTTLLILFFTLNVSANGFGQDKISLKLKKTELGGVLRSIEKQTNYRFLYNNNLEDIREKVSINVKEAAISDVLSLLLDNTRLLYQVMENNLIIIKEDPTAPIRVPDVTIRGKVTGEGGVALSGVSVQVKGSTNGTTTNIEGSFSITAPDANVTLVFSSVGYDNKEVALGGQTDITVALTTSTKTIDEVVVIGYGVANKRDLTGSIVKIAGKEVADKPNTNPIASLQSKVAGLSVVNNGTPGAAPDIRIRGTVSLGQVHPLYIVDGIFNDNIDYINPNDIESIEILKDPSSLAIFGVRGATGVIAITTKKAKAGQTIINFNVSHGFKKLVDKIKLANADQFKELYAEERANLGITTPYDYTGLTANTDWIDAVTRKAQFSSYNLSMAGSTEKNRFNLGLGYTADEGIIRHQKLEKALLSFSDEFKINKAIKIGVTLNASRTNNPYGDATEVLNRARQVVPMVSPGTKQFFVKDPYSADSLNMDIYSALNTGLQASGVVNPLVKLENEWDKTIDIEYRTVGSAYAEITFLKNFTFRSTFYADMSTVNKRQYTPLYYNYNPVDLTTSLASQKTTIREDDNTYRKFQQDHILTYRKSFGDHSLTATAGFTTYYFGNFNRTGTSSQGSSDAALPIPDDKRFWYVNSGLFIDPSSFSSNSGQTEYSTVSGLARVLYNYKGKYYLNGSIRNDASSRLPPSNRNQIFWATGAAWELTKENFMQNQKIFDFLKLKGSIGVLGNQSVVDAGGVTSIDYPFYPLLQTGLSAVFGTNVFAAARQLWERNPNLKWETVHANEIGVELNAFQNRLHFEGNYFNRTTKDLMTYATRPNAGQDKLVNGGSIRNWGEELMASWNQNLSRDLSLTVGGNITFIKNKVLSLTSEIANAKIIRASQNNNTATSVTEPGMPIGYFFGYVVEGVYQSYADVLNSPNAAGVGGAQPGDLKFKDINGPDGKGPDGKITADDRTIIGNPTPKFTYGGTIAVNYKGLSLGVDVGGVYGNQVFRAWGSLESGFQRVNYPAYKLNRWHGPGTSNWDPILDESHTINKNGSSYNIEDGSYFRVRNIQLSYSFPKNMISKAFMKDLRVFVNVQNLKTWKNNSGYTSEFGGDATSFGYDVAGGAIPVVSTVGLNVTF